jgi:phosphoglycolate phosphatase
MSLSPKLLIFDWDGTLMDSEARIVACMQAAAADLNLAIPSLESTRNIIGLGLKEAVMTLFPWLDETRLVKMAQHYRHHFLRGNETPSTLFPGVDETIRKLANRGYLLAVATGKGRHGLDLALESTGLMDYFHATRCADETFSKPHPEMLLQILDQLAVSPQNALMIGDTEYDLQMANNAGVKGVAVSYGVHPLEKLLVHDPLIYLHDIREICDWLEEIGET